MSLQIWLPLTKDLRQQGVSNVTVTNNGATFNSAGKLGGSYDLTSGPITLSNLPNPSEISIAFWFKRTANTGTRQFMFTAWTGVTCELTTDDKPTFAVNRSSYPTITGNAITTSSGWVHYCGTFSQTEGMKLYINGSLVASNSNTSAIVWGTTTGQIGKYSSYASMSAQINDFRLYDHCLSPMEVKQLSQGLILHYPLNRQGWGQENLIAGYDTSFLSYPDGAVTLFSNQMNGGAQEIVSNIGGATKCLHLHSNGGSSRQYGTLNVTSGKSYIISCDYYSTSSQAVPFRGELNGGNYSWAGSNAAAYTTPNKWVRLFFSYPNLTSGATLYYFMQCSQNTDCYIKNLKIEEGLIATPWCPNSSDALATIMGLNGTTEYDTSGYCNNSVYNSKPTVSSDTPKYNVSTYFGAYNTPKTDLIDTSLLVALTNCSIAWWAKTDVAKTLFFTGQDGSHYVMASNNNNFYHQNAGSPTIYRDGIAGTYKNEAGVWHHYVMTGVNISSWTQFRINSYSSWPLNGLVSDVRIYATALSAEDVKQLYNSNRL